MVTGMSGAGKSSALKTMEDLGYDCVDNLPFELIPKFIEMLQIVGKDQARIAVGLDVRSGKSVQELLQVLEEIKDAGLTVNVIFLEASDTVLIRRYKETRRTHPLARANQRIEQGIAAERRYLRELKEVANHVVDTSYMQFRDLRSSLRAILEQHKPASDMFVTVLSFGFKYGIPRDADIVFDVRFLPNPYYVAELREKTGEEDAVQDYVMNNEMAQKFLKKLEDLLLYILPSYVEEGKNQLLIAIGCTGGKHRSVTLAEELYTRLAKEPAYDVYVEHRDIDI